MGVTPQACPVAAIRPFLSTAQQFDNKEFVVSHYLRRHALNLIVKQPRTPENVTFLKALLTQVEEEQGKLKTEVGERNARTVVTETALRIFTTADDLERETKQPSARAIQLFFVASLLFETTAQFNDDKMDPFAAEKHKYARYVAALMKKAQEGKEPYVSPSGGEAAPPPAWLEASERPPSSQSASEGQTPSPPPPSAPPQAPPEHMQAYPPPSPPLQHSAYAPEQQPQPYVHQPPYQQPQQSHVLNAPPPEQAPPPAPKQSQDPPQSAAAPSSGITRMSGSAGRHKADRILAAEKHARQAIAALQFFDETTARTQLLKAAEILEA